MRLIVAIVLLCTLAACQPYELTNEEQDVALQKTLIHELLDENQALIEQNTNLRIIAIQYAENLSKTKVTLQTCVAACPIINGTIDKPNPQIRVPITDINVFKDKVIMDIAGVTYGTIGTTDSMDPLLDENMVVLEVTPRSPAELNEGDIIIYIYQDDRIIHRITKIDHDAQGWYAITKGDNNLFSDPYKVRFEDVQGVVVGIIY